MSHIKAPRFMDNIIGRLLMGYSGVPILSSTTCNNRRCKGARQSGVQVSYYFPPWIVSRMVNIIAIWSSQSRPSMSLRLMRIIPDDSPLFTYVRQGNTSSIQSLFQQGVASPIDICASDGRSALHVALYAGRPETARFLIERKADCEYEDKYFNSAVGACWEMTFQKIPTLLPCTMGESTEDTDFLDKREFTILHKIVLGLTSIPLAEHLVLSTANIDAKDVSGRTALHWASVRGDFDSIQSLLASGADLNVLSEAHWSALHHAATSEIPATFEPLLKGGAKVDEPNNRGDTTLSIVALVHDDPDFLDRLHKYGADMHCTNQRGETALHRAALRDNVRTARWLRDRGVHMNQSDNMGYTALHQCVRNGSHSTLAVLLDAECRTDLCSNDGRTILHDAAAHGDLETLQMLCNASLDSINIDTTNAKGMSAESVFNVIRHEHVAEDDSERLQSMRVFESLLNRLRHREKRSGIAECDFAADSPTLAYEVEKFFDTAEKIESSLTSSLVSLSSSEEFSAD
ncbi:hypothetical protein LTR16_001705 [Cryomyces antarcticus]|uniref:Ankyrin n=1 Tax=Cryomyces antarcticus TaxID=329879 RepID=A0ABR0LQ58_9PEZI|nr:hypothetical protein LTR39_001748 [Cryomyces antarcticus]KAK5201723.1 hypothetical protein LTR16_001705 [Cryomyces antarcticus]